MTRVDFYVLEHGGAEPHDRLICRVVEKAWQRGHRVYVQCPDRDAARGFDDFLWRFQDISFVPHALDDDTGPVAIGTDAGRAAVPDVLVNLCDEVPAAASRFERVIESAGFDDATRGAPRARYRHYQDRGFPLHTHKVGR